MDETFLALIDLLIKQNELSNGFRGKHFYDIVNDFNTVSNNEFYAYIYDKPVLAFTELLSSIVYKKSTNSLSLEEQRSTFYETYFPYLFYKAGRKVFRFKEDLIYLLLETDLNKVDSFFLRTPFKCIYLPIPETTKLLNPTGIPIDGIYVAVTDKEETNPAGLSDGFHNITNQEFMDCKEPRNLFIGVVSDLILSRNDSRNSFYYWNILFKEGDLLEQIEKYLDRYDRELSGRYDYSRNFLERIFSFVLNALLYINYKGEDFEIVKPKLDTHIKSKKKKNKLANKTKIQSYMVGQDIIINPRYKKEIDLSLSNTNYRIRGKYSGRWMVRGHMKTQKFGKQWSESKIIWVQPYEKGEGDLTDKDYLIT
jgi:hypothetical protein